MFIWRKLFADVRYTSLRRLFFCVPVGGNVSFTPFFFRSVTSRQRDEERSGSRRSANVWLGRLVVCVCQQNRGGGRRGGGEGRWARLKHESGDTRTAHFLSPLYQHPLLLHLRKSSPQINVCASWFSWGAPVIDSGAPPPLSSFIGPSEKLQPLLCFTVPQRCL